MNRTPLIWPFDRKASKAMEDQRAARVAAVAERRNGTPAAVPRHLNQLMNVKSERKRGKILLTIQSVVNAITKS